MSNLTDYRGRTALVTGAGDGIGEMLAKGFASAGMRVLVQDIRADAAERVAAEIGPDASPLVFDVSDRDATMAAAQKLADAGTRLALLWINAGVGAGAPLILGRPNVIDWAMSVNVLGMVWTAQAFRPLMTDEAGPRHVGVTASTAYLRPPEGDFPLYAVTKHSSLAVAEALRHELARDKIGATILCPGLLNTDIWDGARARPERFGGVSRRDPATAGRWKSAKPPNVMWPHIARTVDAGGGYLVCATDGQDTAKALRARTDAMLAGYVEV